MFFTAGGHLNTFQVLPCDLNESGTPSHRKKNKFKLSFLMNIGLKLSKNFYIWVMHQGQKDKTIKKIIFVQFSYPLNYSHIHNKFTMQCCIKKQIFGILFFVDLLVCVCVCAWGGGGGWVH